MSAQNDNHYQAINTDLIEWDQVKVMYVYDFIGSFVPFEQETKESEEKQRKQKSYDTKKREHALPVKISSYVYINIINILLFVNHFKSMSNTLQNCGIVTPKYVSHELYTKGKHSECRVAFELARTFSNQIWALAMDVRKNSHQVEGYKGYFGRDICHHMKRMRMDCVLLKMLSSLPAMEMLGNKPNSKTGSDHTSDETHNYRKSAATFPRTHFHKCTHKNDRCALANCELLLIHGYLDCTGQKTRGNRLPRDDQWVTFSSNKNTIYNFNFHLFQKNKRFFELFGFNVCTPFIYILYTYTFFFLFFFFFAYSFNGLFDACISQIDFRAQSSIDSSQQKGQSLMAALKERQDLTYETAE
ncbi:hypothetical protein RFI_11711, partial [Reticulomyxa filosa]